MARMKQAELEHLSNEDIRLFFIAEDNKDLPSPIKEFVGKDDNEFGISERRNRVEKLLIIIITERFIKGHVKKY